MGNQAKSIDREAARARLRQGVTAPEATTSPYPAGVPGSITRRDGQRARIVTELQAEPDDLIVVESASDDLIQVVGAVVDKVWPAHSFLDVTLKAELVAHDVLVRATSLKERR